MFKIFYIVLFITLTSFSSNSEENIDQWEDSEKTYRDLIDDGFEVKAYDTNTIQTAAGLVIILFVNTVVPPGASIIKFELAIKLICSSIGFACIFGLSIGSRHAGCEPRAHGCSCWYAESRHVGAGWEVTHDSLPRRRRGQCCARRYDGQFLHDG